PPWGCASWLAPSLAPFGTWVKNVNGFPQASLRSRTASRKPCRAPHAREATLLTLTARRPCGTIDPHEYQRPARSDFRPAAADDRAGHRARPDQLPCPAARHRSHQGEHQAFCAGRADAAARRGGPARRLLWARAELEEKG